MPRIRKTSGGKEEALLARARELKKDPLPLLPTLAPGTPEAPFERIRRELLAVQESAEDTEALRRLMTRGEDLARAYAGLLYFAEERPDVVMVVARYPTGEIPYMPVGSASPEAHIAVQYYSDPRRLLLGYLAMTRPRLLGPGGFHFYATERKVVCTGKEARPPPEFLAASVNRLPYKLQRVDAKEGDRRVCSHLQRGETQPYLEVHWDAAEAVYRVCRKCVRSDTHLLSSLLESMAVPDPEGSFQVSADYNLDHQHPGACPLRASGSIDGGEERRYRRGRISDADLLAGFVKEAETSLLATRGTAFVAGGRCFGSDAKAFVDSLSPTPAERRALTEVVSGFGAPLLVPEATSGKAVEVLWKDHAAELVEAMGIDEGEAEALVREFRNSPGRVSGLLERLYQKGKEQEVLATLPTYADMVPEAAFCVDASRVYRTQGAGPLEARLTSSLPEAGKVRGLAWSFLVILGPAAERHRWRFTDKEREFGESLVPAARQVLEAPAEEYDRAMGELLSHAGVTSWGRRVS